MSMDVTWKTPRKSRAYSAGQNVLEIDDEAIKFRGISRDLATKVNPGVETNLSFSWEAINDVDVPSCA